jgi:3-hydroxyisobutyrate dehydrogenase-like beta-hydroxyacid dehydrogenase
LRRRNFGAKKERKPPERRGASSAESFYDAPPAAMQSFAGNARLASSIAEVGREAESQAGIGEKDLQLAAMTAADLHVPLPSALHARELVRQAMTSV